MSESRLEYPYRQHFTCECEYREIEPTGRKQLCLESPSYEIRARFAVG